ncbi:MAG: hypothetical protein LBM27_00380 [Lactobacillaceae bacterium]|jgi:hypothetical protein|nr:hypothetical protein [Lactobacillaceae bacterium]
MKRSALNNLIAAGLSLALVGGVGFGVSKMIIPAFGINKTRVEPTISKYVRDILAKQIKTYNKVAPSLWPNNKDVNLESIVQDIDNDVFWKIEPNGKVTRISKSEVLKHEDIMLMKIPGWFQGYATKNGAGAFMAASKKEMADVNRLKRYPHLGTYDLFITYSHEMFHATNQEEWAFPDKQYNTDSNEYLKRYEARAVRLQLQTELMKAYVDKDEKALSKALGTYQYYKDNFKQDYNDTLLNDRLEGTAFYYEIRSSLFAGYPSQVTSMSENDTAVKNLFLNHTDDYLDSGAYAETYNVGALAGFVLDWQADAHHQSRDIWKKAMATQKDTSPMQYLLDHSSLKRTAFVPKYTKSEYLNKYQEILKYKHLD